MNGENGIQLCQEIAHLKCQDKIHGHFTIGPQPFLQQSLIISFNLKFRKQVGMLTQWNIKSNVDSQNLKIELSPT